jgi:hypothetical protein
VAGVDEVEGFGFMKPWTFCVVDHEFDVWREPVRLDWTEIDT